jgi:hypothetical protein
MLDVLTLLWHVLLALGPSSAAIIALVTATVHATSLLAGKTRAARVS